MPVEISITTAASALLSVALVVSTLIWKLVPARSARRAARYDATDIALLANEMQHVRSDIDEIKAEVKWIRARLAR